MDNTTQWQKVWRYHHGVILSHKEGQTVQWPSQRFEYTKGYSEVVNLIMDNTMTKSKKTKRQTIIYKTFHKKLSIDENELQ